MKETAMIEKIADGSYQVKSHTGNGMKYRVVLEPKPSCTCPHFQKRLAVTWEGGEQGLVCKHIEDVMIAEGKMGEKDRKGGSKNGPWLSKGGYNMDEVTSAVQKAIRRGEEKEAGFWALEMVDGGYWRYLLHRLQTIACEDIGLANPSAVLIVSAVRQGMEMRWREMQERGKNWMPVPTEQIGFLILYLCRSPKSRMADDFMWLLQKKRKEGMKLEMPEHAIDEHTKRGKERIKGIAREKGITVEKAQEEEFYRKGGLLKDGDNAEKVGGINWSQALFSDMDIPYTGYSLKDFHIVR